jgi:phospholipid/cholesterol/gamma-HCH transport system substrate-binding protein
MKNKSKTEIRVGIITIASIIVVLWILGWAKNIDPLDEKLLLNIKFDSVAGLNVGDPVAINGVKKGYVNNISSIDNGVLVNVTLEKDVIINEDAKISVMMLDLMGGKIIEINPGQSKKTIDFSITQAGSFSGDISTAMAALSSVQNDLIDLVLQL